VPKGWKGKLVRDGMVTSYFIRDGKMRSRHVLGGGAEYDEGVPGGWIPETLLVRNH
jgi:hypothetical protein